MAMKLRGALLGAGNIALGGHAPQWTEDPWLEGAVEIVAVADLSPTNLQAARAAFPNARPYGDALALLDREALDFCDVCTPPFTHRPLVEAAAEKGLHVLCEKPFAPGIDDAEAIAATVRRSGIVFRPCHQYHFSPQWQTVLRWLPRLGRVYLAEYEVDRTSANPGNANWTPAWRTDRVLAGGGILFDHGAHIFYQLRRALGEPQTVQAVTRTLCHTGYDVEDSAFVVLEFGGGLAHVRLTWAARRRAIRFRFVGEHGEISGDDETVRIDGETKEEARFDDGMSKNSSHSEWYTPLFRDFVERVRRGDASTDGLDEAVYVNRVIDRAYASSRQGRALPLVEPAGLGGDVAYPVAAPALAGTELEPRGDERAEDAETRASLRNLRRWGLRVGALTLMAAGFLWAGHDIDWTDLKIALGEAQLPWLALAAVVNFGVLYVQAWRWFALVRPLSPLVTMGQAFQATIVGFAVSTVVPARAGELARVEWLGRRAQLPRFSVLASVVLDHLVNGLGLVVAIALLPLFTEVPLWLGPGAWIAGALFVVAAVLVFVLRPREDDPRDVLRLAAGALTHSGIRRLALQLRAGLGAVRSRRALAVSVSASFISWALEVNVTMLSLRAMGLRLPLLASILVLLAVNLALALPLAPPGNMGTLELGATVALLRFGVPKEQALAFALCYHFLQVGPIVIAGLFFASRAAARERREAAAA
jgi:uncharacterized protein (TIRG00374 family)